MEGKKVWIEEADDGGQSHARKQNSQSATYPPGTKFAIGGIKFIEKRFHDQCFLLGGVSLMVLDELSWIMSAKSFIGGKVKLTEHG